MNSRALSTPRSTTATTGSTSEYVRDLIRRDHDRRQLRAALLEGARTRVTGNADAAYFASLRQRAETDD